MRLTPKLPKTYSPKTNSSIAALVCLAIFLTLPGFSARGADVPGANAPLSGLTSDFHASSHSYVWRSTPIHGGAEVLTLFGRYQTAFGSKESAEDVPLVSILRDSLGDQDTANDRLRYVWLLTYARPSLKQRVLSAIPFFYWQVGSGTDKVGKNAPKPLADLSRPAQGLLARLGQDVVQWSTLDPAAIPVRASSRAYRTNQADHQRLHIQEAISFLQKAPSANDGQSPTSDELTAVVARLTLAKNLLGGLVDEGRLTSIANGRRLQREGSRGRNWELLRTLAERTGLYFEPLQLDGSSGDYGLLWFPVDREFSSSGVSLNSSWKLLQISNPWEDTRLSKQQKFRQLRSFDADGRLLAAGQTGVSQTYLVPLAVYSLDYPRMPLLMVDFRNQFKTKRRELLQRTRNELVSGVFGLSHFANWYYYAGNAAYQFVQSRRGKANDRNERLDCYSQFRVALALDRSLDEDFRKEMQHRVDDLSTNPLEQSPDKEVTMARLQYASLHHAAIDPHALPARLAKDRRQELASFGEGTASSVAAEIVHYLSFGQYTRRTPEAANNLRMLDRDRRMENALRFLSAVADAGPSPEVTYPAADIQDAIAQVESLTSMRTPSLIRKRATLLLTRVQANSKDEVLRADCVRTLAVLHGGVLQKERRVAANTPVDDAPSGGLSTVTPVALQTLVGKQ